MAQQTKFIIMMRREKQKLLFTLDEPNLMNQIQLNLYKRQCYISKYKIASELGGGAFARVYQCESSQDKQKYALKIYSYSVIRAKFDGIFRQKMMGYIDQEAKLLQKCNSRHIVKCYQAIQTPDYMILVLEYCSNENLWGFLLRKGGPSKCLPQPEAINIIAHISLGLIELHKRNIVHRDLKLQNIMVKKGICKIIDLGLSRQLQNEVSLMGTNVGTDYTKAPEVKRGQYYGLKADIYSLGIIYLHLISDCSFEKRSAHNFYNNRGVLFSNKLSISQDSIYFISKTCEVNPYNRLSWQELRNQQLFKYMKHEMRSSISQIIDVQDNLKSELNNGAILEIDYNFSATSSPNSNIKSTIYYEEQKQIEEQIAPSIIRQSHISRDYSEKVREHVLNCKKTEFLLVELIKNIQSNINRKMDQQMESCHILLYLLSLQAYNMTSQAQSYYKANFYQQFQAESNNLLSKINIKLQLYKQILIGLLKCVREAFIQNQILRNYQPLKDFLQFQKVRPKNLQQQHINLIVYYIKKLTRIGFFNRNVRVRLYSFQKVMMITLEDLKLSNFEAKVTAIRLSYSVRQ